MHRVIAVLAAIALLWWFYPEPEFTDLLGQEPSPDGEIKAAYVVENHGPMAGTTYGITLSGKSDNPLAAKPVLTEGEDDRAIQYRWASLNVLEIRLPCGWWAHLTNHHQLAGTDRVIDIVYLPPQGCAGVRITPSSSVPR